MYIPKPFPSRLHKIKNIIPSKEAENSSPTNQVHQEHYPYEGSRRLFPNGLSTSRTSFPWRRQKILPRWTQAHLNNPQWGSRRFFPKISLANQVRLKYPLWGSRRFFPSESNTPKNPLQGSRRFLPNGSRIYTTPQRVHSYYSSMNFSSPSKSWKRQKIPPYAHLLLSEFSPSPVDATIKTTRAHILRELNMQAW